MTQIQEGWFGLAGVALGLVGGLAVAWFQTWRAERQAARAARADVFMQRANVLCSMLSDLYCVDETVRNARGGYGLGDTLDRFRMQLASQLIESATANPTIADEAAKQASAIIPTAEDRAKSLEGAVTDFRESAAAASRYVNAALAKAGEYGFLPPQGQFRHPLLLIYAHLVFQDILKELVPNNGDKALNNLLGFSLDIAALADYERKIAQHELGLHKEVAKMPTLRCFQILEAQVPPTE